MEGCDTRGNQIVFRSFDHDGYYQTGQSNLYWKEDENYLCWESEF